MKKYFLLLGGLLVGAGVVFAASTIWSTTNIPIKNMADSVSHTEFNSLVQTTKGIYRDDNGTPTDYTDDKFGFGETNPSVALDVKGAIKVGVTAATCGGGIEGALRYNTASNVIELCDGTSWKGMELTAICAPNCSAESVTCLGVVFDDGCGGTCTGTKDCSCTATSWNPPTTDYCSGALFTQTSNCGTTRVATGTNTAGACCTATTWTPATSTVCSGALFTQTSDCGTTRSVIGTKVGTCSSTTAAATCTGVMFADSCGDLTCFGTKQPYTCANVPTGTFPLAMNDIDSMLKSLQAAIITGTGASCGIWPDGCNGTVNCGTCSIGYKCSTSGTCVSTVVACTPESTSSACGTAVCGTVLNNCGDAVNCGSCDPDFLCSSGRCIFDSSSCFIAGTIVEMSDGTYRDIEDLEVGQMVQGMDGDVNEILKTHAYDHDGWMYSINGSGYFVTDSHPFMTRDGWKSFNPNASEQEVGWGVVVGTLGVGDEILREDGTYEKIVSTDRAWKTIKVYNLSVDGQHGFYADGYLVHNLKKL